MGRRPDGRAGGDRRRGPLRCSRPTRRSRGSRVLVSAGGTREPLDAVRFVGNRSSGRMGVALAAEARRRGADVTLLARQPRRAAARRGRARGDADRRRARARGARARGRRRDRDGRRGRRLPAGRRARRRSARRTRSPGPSSSSRRSTSSQAIGERRSDSQVLVGFAAETGEGGLERARDKLARKNARPRRLQRRLRAGDRLRRARERGGAGRRRRRTAPCRGPRRRSSRPRSSTRSSGSSRRDERRVRPLPAGQTPSPQRHAAQATVALEKAKRREPDKTSIREALGIAYLRLRRYDEAAAEFTRILELSPADDFAHYALGRCLEAQGRRVEANGHYKLARSLRPDSEHYAARILDLDAERLKLAEPVAGDAADLVERGDAGERRGGCRPARSVVHAHARRPRRRSPRSSASIRRRIWPATGSTS